MACVYVYGESEAARKAASDSYFKSSRNIPDGAKAYDGTIISDSIWQIREAVYDQFKEKLLRYNDYKQDTKEKLAELAKNPWDHSNSVSNAILEMLRITNVSYKDTAREEFLENIRTGFGTSFHEVLHEVMEGRDPEIKIQAFIDNILKYRNDNYEKLSDDVKKSLEKEPIVKFLFNFDPNVFRADLNQALHEVLNNEHIVGKDLASELPIKSTDSRAMGGIIDLCAYDSDGNFNIIDFKTSSTASGVSKRSVLSHYILLELYKRMLQQNGIQWDNAAIYNANFEFGEDGSFSFTGTTETDQLIDGATRARLNSILDDYVRVRLNPITNAEEESIITKTNDITESLFSTKRLNRRKKDNYKEYIEEKCIGKGYLYTLALSRKKVKISLEGDRLKVIEDNTDKEVENKSGLTLDAFIESELSDVKSREENLLTLYIDALKSRKSSRLQSLLSGTTSETAERLLYNLGKYQNTNWEYLPTPLERFGIITMVNRANPDNTQLDFILLTTDLSAEENLQSPIKLLNGELLLDDVLSPELKKKYVGYDKIPRASIGNVRLLETLIRISQFNQLFKDNVVIGNVTVLSALDGAATQTFDLQPFETTLKILQAESEKEGFANYSTLFSNYDKLNKLDFVLRTTSKIIDAVKTLSYEEKVDIVFPDNYSEKSKEGKITALTKLEGDLESYLKSQNLWASVEERTKEGYNPSSYMDLYMTIGLLINNIKGLPTTESMAVSKKAFTFLDSLIAGALLLISGNMRQYTPDGMLITGLALGLSTSVSYTSPDENVRRINLAIDTYALVLRQLFIQEIQEINDAAIKFLEWNELSLMFGRLLDLLLGYHTAAYMTLIQKDKSGKIDHAFRFINPYTANNLVKEQLDFLETILWHINRYRMHSLSDKVKNMSYSELKRSEHFLEYVKMVNNDGRWLNIPIKAGSSIRLLALGTKEVLVGDRSLKDHFTSLWDRMKEAYDPKYLTKVQTDKKKRAEKELTTFNYYDEGGSREARLQRQSPSEFELNLNYLCNDYVFCSIKLKIEKDLLRTIDHQISGLILYESATGQNVSNLVLAILDRTKISIYNDNLIDEDYKDLATLIGIGKTLGSYALIAGRYALYAKEMLAGRIRNLTALLADYIYNGEKITFQNMMEAAGIVFGEGIITSKFDKLTGKIHPGQFELVDLINNLYAITDRDMNIYSERLTADNYGFFNVGSRTLYLNTVRPDWFNRMIIFIAKMKADGTWEAHHRTADGLLVYKMSEDKRFSEYYRHRNEKGYNTESFRKLKALYEAMMDEFISAGFRNADGSLLERGLDLPMAYTPMERNSIKEQIGALYGYYDHEEKAAFQSATWYNLFMQFTTYLPGDLKRFFSTGKNSSVGSFVHLKDEQGNLLYVYQDPNSHLDVITTEKVRNGVYLEPYTKWEGHLVEGLMISLFKTAHDLGTLDFKHLKENPLQYKNALLGLFQMIFASLIGSFMLMLATGGTKKKKDMSYQTAALYDIVTKAANDITFYNSVVQPVLGINFAGLQYFTNLVADTFKVLSGDDYGMLNALYENLAAFKDTHLYD